MQYFLTLFITFLFSSIAFSAEPSAFSISQTPLFTLLAGKPNILLILDNSGSMAEDINGNNIPKCSGSPLPNPCSYYGSGDDSLGSKGLIAKTAAKTFISQVEGQVNLGLMLFKYSGSSTLGYGNLVYPVAELNSTRVDYFNNANTGILNCNVPYYNGSTANTSRTAKCNSNGIQNLYGTPLEGTLLSSRNYYKNALKSSENGTGQALSQVNTNGNIFPNLPPSCGKNYVILLTDGEPTVNKSGGSYSSNTSAVNATVTAAKSLKDSGYLVYVIGLGTGVAKTNTDKIAAAGGTGSSYNPQSTEELSDAFNAIFADVMSRSGSAASVATNSAQFNIDTSVYQARFNTENWYGQFLKFQTDNTTGNVSSTPDWDSASILNSQPWSTSSTASNRRIIITARRPSSTDTPGPSTGIPFKWPANSSSPGSSEIYPWQIAALNKNESNVTDNQGSLRINWLRGDRSKEGSGTSDFRARTSVLGDLVNSYPVYVSPPAETYSDESYKTFRSTYSSRPSVVYVGGNDGFLHGFSVSNGTEILAYAPSASFKKFSKLMRQDYQQNHIFTVDGSPSFADVQFNDGSWHTVLVGGMGAGGRLFYALNITNTSSDSTKPDPVFTDTTTNASKIVLWEFSDTNSQSGTLSSSGNPTGAVNGDSDLGFTYAKPAIVKLNNNKWVAIIGNGYNNTDASMGASSTTGYAAMYVIDIETGNLIKKISVPVGTTSIPNGLGSIRTFDQNNDGKADYAYAGDLYGNIWKFDLSNSNPTLWNHAFLSGSTPQPLFTVSVGSPANPRPITGDLRVTKHPNGGQVVLFGTGRYMAISDMKNTYNSQDTDAVYSIWDRGSIISGGRSSLLGQTQSGCQSTANLSNLSDSDACNGSQEFNYFSTSSSNSQNFCKSGENPSTHSCYLGCYLDLTNVPNLGQNGERFIYFPQVSSGTAAFNTIIPAVSGCAVDGYTNELILDYLSCSPLNYSPYDVNGDGNFTSLDLIVISETQKTVPSGHVINGLAPPGTRVYTTSTGITKVYQSNSTGSAPTLENIYLKDRAGRVSWRELKQIPSN